MKTRFYKLSLPFLLIAVLASCMKSETEPVSMPVSGEADLEFSYSVPDYTVVRTKSAESTVNDISLLQFDADGRFLGRLGRIPTCRAVRSRRRCRGVRVSCIS